MNSELSRQGRYKAIMLDEFAFVENAEVVWRACGDSAPCKVVVSTPNGSGNFFQTLRDSGRIKVNTLHWKLHPYKDEIWYEKQKIDRSDKDIAQELDINYEVSAGEPFYSGFRPDLHTGDFRHVNKELLIGWDFGFIHPAVVVTQMDHRDRWIVLRELMGHRVTIDIFADQVISMLNNIYPGIPCRHFGDPACMQVNDKSEFTSYQILQNKGIQINFRQSEYRQRKEIIEYRLHTLYDGKPALMFDKTCEILIKAFRGGYHYPTLKDGQQFLQKFEFPFKDGFFDHTCNALEYIAVCIFSPIQRKIPPEQRGPQDYKSKRPINQPHKAYNLANI